MKISKSFKLVLALTFSLISTHSLAESSNEIPYECEVTNMRDSVIQKVYDYTAGIDDTLKEAKTNVKWLAEGDKFEIALNAEKLITNEPTTEELQVRLKVTENSCDGGIVEVNKNVDFFRRLNKNNKPTLEENSVKYSEMYSGNMDLKINGNNLSGKMRLNVSGTFNSELCHILSFESVIVKFTCTKK